MTRSKRSAVRDPSQLSGKPLSQTLEASLLRAIVNNNTRSAAANQNDAADQHWVTSPDLTQNDLPFTPDIIYNLTLFLMGNPNMNSSHVFRADILFDSLGVLQTPEEKERLFMSGQHTVSCSDASLSPDSTATPQSLVQVDDQVESVPARKIPGFELKRTVVRRLIPRNPNLDRALEQTCHFYEGQMTTPMKERSLYMYTPHISSKEDIPYYHPLLRALVFYYEFERQQVNAKVFLQNSRETATGKGTLSIHFCPFPGSESFDPIPTRLERTLLALLSTQIRLARATRPAAAYTPQQISNVAAGGSYNLSKDNIIPRHIIQDTYTRLKLTYGVELCRDWVEETEPSKHVFEDLSIAAFLIELWKSMYGVLPKTERKKDNGENHAHKNNSGSIKDTSFPGFVDVASGNGVLVYVLLMEGYQGWGFDARRRKTWSIFPRFVQDQLKESLYIPKPFTDILSGQEEFCRLTRVVDIHTGMFSKDTFIISNHADELTVWTPLMAALANPTSPLPFISIPCCSHSLSGARYRYPPPKPPKKTKNKANEEEEEEDTEQNPQPATGDLKALRTAKIAASTASQTDLAAPNTTAFLTSMYGSLIAKTMSISEELGYETEKTLLRIPSTRNVGVIGGRKRVAEEWTRRRQQKTLPGYRFTDNEKKGLEIEDDGTLCETAMQIIRHECAREGGIDNAARIWVQRAESLHKGPGKGRQKESHIPSCKRGAKVEEGKEAGS